MNAGVLPLLAALCVAGCAVGVEVEDFRPAQEPAGIGATIDLQRGLVPGNELEGELLAAAGDGFVLLLDRPLDTADGARSLVRVPLWMARRIRLEQMGSHEVSSEGSESDRQKLEQLARVARYPQGLTPRIEGALLAGLGQPAIWVPEAPPQP